MAVAVRRKNVVGASQWSPRMAGLLLCAFFLLGVMTGFSEAGRRVTLRAKNLIQAWTERATAKFAAHRFDQSIAPIEAMLRLRRPAVKPARAVAARKGRDDAIAIVSRRDGFYVLLGGGEIRGPVSPNSQPDLAILSGPGAENALADELVADAALLVRAETQLQSLVSEMRLEGDGSASLFLDRARMAIVVDLDQEPAQLRRANQVLKQWQGRERFIAMLDMTAPGMAIVRQRADLPKMFEDPKRAAQPLRSVSIARWSR